MSIIVELSTKRLLTEERLKVVLADRLIQYNKLSKPLIPYNPNVVFTYYNTHTT